MKKLLSTVILPLYRAIVKYYPLQTVSVEEYIVKIKTCTTITISTGIILDQSNMRVDGYTLCHGLNKYGRSIYFSHSVFSRNYVPGMEQRVEQYMNEVKDMAEFVAEKIRKAWPEKGIEIENASKLADEMTGDYMHIVA